jgi:hypothetical protein
MVAHCPHNAYIAGHGLRGVARKGRAKMSKTIQQQYANVNNGGQERVMRNGDNYYVSSDYGKGFCAPVAVSKAQAAQCMTYTKAPATVVAAILGD